MGDLCFSFTTTKAAFVEAECCGGKLQSANLLANSSMTTSEHSLGSNFGCSLCYGLAVRDSELGALRG